MEGEAVGRQPGQISAADGLVWIVRVILPILLFWIWYRTQPGSKGSSRRHAYSREDLISVREALGEDDPPEPLRSLRLVAEAHVQKVLGGPGPRAGGAGGAAAPGVGRREPGGGKGAGRGRGQDKGGAKGGAAAGRAGRGGAEAAACDAEAPGLLEEERLQLESLLNFVAFSYKDRPKRVFLPGSPPPPPPRRPGGLDGASGSGGKVEADLTESAKANVHAQLVLKGLANPKTGLRSADVAKVLIQQLEESLVKPSEATFTLMVESCVAAGDLRMASDLLVKMESAGHSAHSELLDKVMDLYSVTRSPSAGPDSSRPPAAAAAASPGPGPSGAARYDFADAGLRPPPAAQGQGEGGWDSEEEEGFVLHAGAEAWPPRGDAPPRPAPPQYGGWDDGDEDDDYGG